MDIAVPLFLRREPLPPSTRRPGAAPAAVASLGAVPRHRRAGHGTPLFLRCLAVHMYFAQHTGALD